MQARTQITLYQTPLLALGLSEGASATDQLGLSTLSYLLEGQMIHRDSEGHTEKHKRRKLPSKPQMQKLRKVFRSAWWVRSHMPRTSP